MQDPTFSDPEPEEGFASAVVPVAKCVAGPYVRSSRERHLRIAGATATAAYRGLVLGTVFQPIISLAHQRTVGHEALLRAHDDQGRPVAPLGALQRAEGHNELAELDGICRALHLKNFELRAPATGWLFCNMSPALALELTEHPDALLGFKRDQGALPPERVVVEIVEAEAQEEGRLTDAVAKLRELGCLVAIDDFGAGHSNFERIWRIAPDIVKLDRAMIARAMESRKVRRMLASIIALIHEAECLAVLEGIESEEQAMLAMDGDADFVQGFYFAEPCARIDADPPERVERVQRLFDRFRGQSARRTFQERALLSRYSSKLEQVALALQQGAPVERACADLLSSPGVARCYLLDANGVQVGNCAMASGPSARDVRYAPCAETAGASWLRRCHFRDALMQPMTLQLSRPYLSVFDGRSCVTLSFAVPLKHGIRVICVDLSRGSEAFELCGHRSSWSQTP